MTVSLLAECKTTYKILLLGDSNVGKTSLIHRYCGDDYSGKYIATIGVDFKQKIIELDSLAIKLHIWDTGGAERFRTLTTAYYRGAMGILLVYDVTNIDSFNHLPYWLKTIEENASPNVVKVLVGNKCDAESERIIDKFNGNSILLEEPPPSDLNISLDKLNLKDTCQEKLKCNYC
ncbi:hypothetical protein PGB90_007965 [Kerria lacca]